jgi:hypothetical protein
MTNTTATDKEILGASHILGEWYHLTLNDEGYYTLIDDDGDEYSEPFHKYHLTATPLSTPEAIEEIISELYLRHNKAFGFKSKEITSRTLIKSYEAVYDAGRKAGRKEQMKLIIEDLETDLDNM